MIFPDLRRKMMFNDQNETKDAIDPIEEQTNIEEKVSTDVPLEEKVEKKPEVVEEISKEEISKQEEVIEKKKSEIKTDVPLEEKVEEKPEVVEDISKKEISKQEEVIEEKKPEIKTDVPLEEKIEEKPEVVEEISKEKISKQEEVVEEKKPEIKTDVPLEEKIEEKPEVVEEISKEEIPKLEKVIEEKKPETKGKKVKEKKTKTKDDDFVVLLDESFSKFTKGAIIDGDVVSVDEREVLVDIGFKSEGSISSREFSQTRFPDLGSKIKVYIESIEDGSGRLKLSKRKADFYSSLERFNQLMETNGSITGILRRRVKGGMIVEIDNLEAFLPGSQISTKPIPNLDQFIGKESEFKILKIDKERRNIIVSRKKVLEERRENQIKELRDKIIVGSELDGEVRNITEYGAFIDLGGIDGLLHITDMSWGHIKHPSDMLNIGDKVKVKVLGYNEENSKVSLGIKQLVPHPWENIEAKCPEGSIVSGKVVNITPYGVFVEIEPGVEGLVHISEMSWTKRIKHPKQMVKVGDNIKAIVLTTSRDAHRISLGIKQMEPNPWLTIEERYPIGEKITGKVKSITPFGIFIEIEENIEGLIHISDISWTKRIYHPKDVFKKGSELEVKVLSIDKTLHRIALGIKQLAPDPWDKLDELLPINSEIKAKIVKIISKGVLVDVSAGEHVIEGFVPLSHLSIPGLKRANLAFDTDDIIPLKIIELDLENRRLILSVKAYFFAKDKEELQEYIKIHEDKLKAKTERRKTRKEKPMRKPLQESVQEKKEDVPVKEETVEKKISEPQEPVKAEKDESIEDKPQEAKSESKETPADEQEKIETEKEPEATPKATPEAKEEKPEIVDKTPIEPEKEKEEEVVAEALTEIPEEKKETIEEKLPAEPIESTEPTESEPVITEEKPEEEKEEKVEKEKTE